MALITASNLRLAYDRRIVVDDLSLALPEGRITIIVGANGCGKSTLLRGLSRLLPPRAGSVVLDGKDIHSLRGKDLARRLGLLPQSPVAPDGVSVRDLVSRGRFPHQGLFHQWSEADQRAVTSALAVTRTDELEDRLLEELSGGQRQRVWIAMALAQETDVLLLDEPTTYLDLTHQLEVLDVVRDLNHDRGTTVAIVLHDLNLAARYADHLIAVKSGEIYAEGAPGAVISEQMVRDVFALEARITPDPVTGTPMVLPLGRGKRAPGVTTRIAQHDDQEDTMTTATDTAASSAATTTPASTTADGTNAAEATEALVPALQHSPMLAYELTVAGRRQLGPSLLRITFTCEDLIHCGTGGHPLDLRIKLIIPGEAPTADHFAPVRPGALLDPVEHGDWYRRWLQIDPSDRGWMRTYTVRDQRAAGHPGNISALPEIDIDFVIHLEPEQTPGNGVAARWAHAAQVGDRISMLGPNRHLVGPEYGGIEFRPGTARTVLLAGDETALPAIGSILEALPDSISGHAIIEVPEDADRQEILTRSGVQVSWLVRGDAPHGELLTDAVESLMSQSAEAFRTDTPASKGDVQDLEDVDIDSSILWETTTGEGTFYAWLAGEAGVIKTLRRHLVTELGLNRKQVSFMGYWRKGRPEN